MGALGFNDDVVFVVNGCHVVIGCVGEDVVALERLTVSHVDERDAFERGLDSLDLECLTRALILGGVGVGGVEVGGHCLAFLFASLTVLIIKAAHVFVHSRLIVSIERSHFSGEW